VHNFFHSKGLSTSLHNYMGLDRMALAVISMLAVALWVLRGRNRPYQGGWKWPLTGICLGLISAAAWTVRAADGKPYGLGMMQGSDGMASLLLEWDLSVLDGSLFMVVGIPLGSFIAAHLYGKSPGKPLTSERIRLALTGGLLMGISAAVAAGDNVLHGLSGVPIFAISSLIFMICVFLGVWTGVKLNWLK